MSLTASLFVGGVGCDACGVFPHHLISSLSGDVVGASNSDDMVFACLRCRARLNW
jgi:hypothetical protein